MQENYSETTKGLVAFRLKKRRYSEGHLYLSAVIYGNRIKALDIRYFIEEDNLITPTQNGFRVSMENISKLMAVLNRNPGDIVDEVISENRKRRLVVNFKDDKYGQGVDFRYYQTTDEYTGWQKKGIRMTLEDFKKLGGIVRNLKLDYSSVLAIGDLFENKIIRQKKADSTTGYKDKSEPRADGAFVNDALDDFLKL